MLGRPDVIAAVAVLVACGGDGAGGKDRVKDRGGTHSDTPTGGGGAETFGPPAPCPVVDLALTQAQLDADVALLDAWNAIRAEGGTCDGVDQPAAPALAAADGLMWASRCWAMDISIAGPQADGSSFSDGTLVVASASAEGYTGEVRGWAVRGGVPDAETALADWVANGGALCEQIFATNVTDAGIAMSEAGGVLVVARLTGG